MVSFRVGDRVRGALERGGLGAGEIWGAEYTRWNGRVKGAEECWLLEAPDLGSGVGTGCEVNARSASDIACR